MGETVFGSGGSMSPGCISIISAIPIESNETIETPLTILTIKSLVTRVSASTALTLRVTQAWKMKRVGRKGALDVQPTAAPVVLKAVSETC